MPDQTHVNNNSNEIIENLTFIELGVYTIAIIYDLLSKSRKRYRFVNNCNSYFAAIAQIRPSYISSNKLNFIILIKNLMKVGIKD